MQKIRFYDGYHHPNKKFWEELIAYFPSYDTDHTQNDAPMFTHCCDKVFIKLLLNNEIFTELLPSNKRGIQGYMHRNTD
jgi:arginine/ornithine N-succinyltransferase beta subunit